MYLTIELAVEVYLQINRSVKVNLSLKISILELMIDSCKNKDDEKLDIFKILFYENGDIYKVMHYYGKQ